MSQSVARYSFVVDSDGTPVQLPGVSDFSYYDRGMRAPIKSGIELSSDFTYPITGQYVAISPETTGEFWGQFLDGGYSPLSDVMFFSRGQTHKISAAFLRVVGVRRAGHVVINCYSTPTAPGVEGAPLPMVNHITVQDSIGGYVSDDGDSTFGLVWRSSSNCGFAMNDVRLRTQTNSTFNINPTYYSSMFFCFFESIDGGLIVQPAYDMLRDIPLDPVTVNPWYKTGVCFIQTAAGIAAEGSNVRPTGYLGSRFLARGTALYAR